ncbi:MAG: TRASH domain-containing protein [Candidatus Altiarchaeota archaeon]|nr:TRASH domain-containing protein [Candidatus Altiarchaeota archaeon]
MECSFCGKEIEKGTESILVTNKGKAFYFCSSKCEKNLLTLRRKPRKIRWTAEYRAEKAIRLKAIASKKEAAKPEKKEAKVAEKRSEKVEKKEAKEKKPAEPEKKAEVKEKKKEKKTEKKEKTKKALKKTSESKSTKEGKK